MIFFDLDGTLLDHEEAEYLGVMDFYFNNESSFDLDKEEFYELWCYISDKHFKRFLDNGISFEQQRTERIKEVFEYGGIELSEAEAEEKFIEYLKVYEDNWKAYDDVIVCLENLHKNYKLGIISNGDLEQQLLKLKRIGVKKYFEVVIVAGDMGVAKPNVEIFEVACERAGVKVEDSYYIGDDLEIDALSCQQAGMKGIWLNRKGEERDGAGVRVINSLEDLSTVIEE